MCLDPLEVSRYMTRYWICAGHETMIDPSSCVRGPFTQCSVQYQYMYRAWFVYSEVVQEIWQKVSCRYVNSRNFRTLRSTELSKTNPPFSCGVFSQESQPLPIGSGLTLRLSILPSSSHPSSVQTQIGRCAARSVPRLLPRIDWIPSAPAPQVPLRSPSARRPRPAPAQRTLHAMQRRRRSGRTERPSDQWTPSSSSPTRSAPSSQIATPKCKHPAGPQWRRESISLSPFMPGCEHAPHSPDRPPPSTVCAGRTLPSPSSSASAGVTCPHMRSRHTWSPPGGSRRSSPPRTRRLAAAASGRASARRWAAPASHAPSLRPRCTPSPSSVRA